MFLGANSGMPSTDVHRTRETVVRVKGVPPKATVADILEFFAGCDLSSDAVQLMFKERRSAGEALVVFKSEEDADRACERDKDFFKPEKFGQRYVRVVITPDVKPEDVKSAAAEGLSQGGSKTTHRVKRQPAAVTSKPHTESIIRISGLPPNVTVPDVAQLLWGIVSKPPAMHFVRPLGANQAEVIMDLETPEVAARAIESWNGTVMTTKAGMFTISVQKASKAEYEEASKVTKGEDIIKLCKLPLGVTTTDVITFFNGFKIKSNGVLLQPSSDKQSQVAFVEFIASDEAARAHKQRDSQPLVLPDADPHPCSLHLVSRSEVDAEISSKLSSSSFFSAGSEGASCLPLPNRHLPGFGVASAMPAIDLWNPAAAMAAMGFTHAFSMPQAGMLPVMPAAAAFPGAAAWAGLQPTPSLSANSVAARYMVQDLSTGQKVYLDPRFNVSYPTGGADPVLGSMPTHVYPSFATQQSQTVKPDHGNKQQAGEKGTPTQHKGNPNNGSSGRSEQTEAGLSGSGSGGSKRNGNGSSDGNGSTDASCLPLLHKRVSCEVPLEEDARPAKHKHAPK